MAQTPFFVARDTNGVPSWAYQPPITKYHYAFGSAGAKTVAVPAGARFCLFSLTAGNLYVRTDGDPAALPTSDSTTSPYSINPSGLYVEGIAELDLYVDAASILGIEWFY